MIDANALIGALPRMLSGDELMRALKVMPEYDPGVCDRDEAVRLMKLSDLYDIYLSSAMSVEIYSKLYLALIRSLQKKGSRLAVRQYAENYRAVKQRDYSGILGGSDSFTIIGTSGIGKSSAISKAIRLISENRIIELEQPHTKIVPCVVVQCPFDSSVKGLLLEILRQVDEELDTRYYDNAVRARATTDMLIGSVSQVALNHIGLLVVDEIQHVVNSKNGKALVGSLTQLINCSGISICMVGTPDSCQFFEQAMQLARRSLGLHYSELPYDRYFREFCGTLFGYQYVRNRTDITEAIIEWLYEHSAGVISIVVSLIHDAQEIAILNGRETLDIVALNEAYQRMQMIHSYVKPAKPRASQVSKPKAKKPVGAADVGSAMKGEVKTPDNVSVAEIVAVAKNENREVVDALREHFSVEEVAV